MDFLKTKNFNITSYLAIAALVLNLILPVVASAGGFSFCDMMKPHSNEEMHHSSSEMNMNNKNEDCHGLEREPQTHCENTLECECILEIQKEPFRITFLNSPVSVQKEFQIAKILTALNIESSQSYPPPDREFSVSPPIFLIHGIFLI